MKKDLYIIQHVGGGEVKSVLVVYNNRVILWTDNHVKNVARAFAEVHVGTTHQLNLDSLDLICSPSDFAQFNDIPDNDAVSKKVAKCVEALFCGIR